ncbi:integrating conjugative element protein [Paracidovorax citrulli]|uniref:Integrating conjugative element protein n=1 Tax=Paracidovorax citrulli TaxID=80869 RepID=A0ABY9AP35_PARCI|nr:integrating conjugative element protein [Paracidovorax citrulli]WIY28963.1 integrating conjugative element protein [Paracidovorax citrulli]WIY38194.1 integrating conjugative element protein [Paracidovorax citrulli]WIY44594.1 integrating conjugative element protein [Paracidovorax citrulli]WIY48517.1 integrating conjugative element protein [Paracidovorax citrulli]
MRLRPCAPLWLLALVCLPSLGLGAEPAKSAPSPRPGLIVIEDRGGVSAQPYYDELGLPPLRASGAPSTGGAAKSTAPVVPVEAVGLPVRSTLLSPGVVEARPLQAPGLPPFFLVGDDARSRAWLQQRAGALRQLRAAGLVVNVESPQALQELRALAPGLVLSPASGDDLARRLGLRHYPALLTATGIEQ